MEYIIYLILAFLFIIPVYLFYLSKNVKKAKEKLEWHKSQTYTTLRIDVPKNNEKTPLSAEQMFASLHGIYSESSKFQNHLSFEIVARDKYIQFYVHIPKHTKDFVEGQIYAQYPSVEINEIVDYTEAVNPSEIKFASSELLLTKPDVYPIKFFSSFEVDPLSGITSVMSKLNTGEEVWFQLLMRPVGDEWQEKGNRIVSAVRAGRKPGGPGLVEMMVGGVKNFSLTLLREAIHPGGENTVEKGEVKLPASVDEALKGIEQKIVKLGFETKIRIFAIAGDPISAKVKCQSIAATFKQFNTTNLNGFKMGEVRSDFNAWEDYVERSFEDEGSILNITELASVYHLPHVSVETPNIVWSGAKKGEPPANLPLTENTPPEDLTVLGVTNFRNVYREFGIKLDDRRRHIYIVGKSGTGKSTLIENMAINDVYSGKGVIVVDPHGDLADKVLSCIPENRENDVIVFDPADRAFPVAFNLLETVDDDFKGMVASGFVGIFKKIFGDSWGPRLEHILRNTVLALLDFPDSTMLDIPKMLTDTRFREKVVEKVKDPVIRDFWVNEFAQYDNKFRTEAVSPILNKIGQFLATATIRNIVGQPKSRINIREIMDQKKILVLNLSRGKIGEDNSALLGAMMITKVQLAAMSRADVPIEQRPDCYLYVDEFQNFATDSFAVILSEARKYNLCLTMANQYIEQMPEAVKSAVFGNAGTIITFRVGGSDASFLVDEFSPVFDENDLVNLERHTIYVKLLIDGIAPPAFSAKTLPPVQKHAGNTERIISLSREKYSTERASVEESINNRSKMEEEELKAEAMAFKKGGLEALLKSRQTGSQSIQNIELNPNPPKTEPVSQPPMPASVENQPHTKELNAPEETSVEAIGETDKKEKPSKPRFFKHQNVIGEKAYKEQTARGGAKWYIGENIDLDKVKELGVEVTQESLDFIELAKKTESFIKKGKEKADKDSLPEDKENIEHKNHKEEQKEKPSVTSLPVETTERIPSANNQLSHELIEKPEIAVTAPVDKDIDETGSRLPAEIKEDDKPEVIAQPPAVKEEVEEYRVNTLKEDTSDQPSVKSGDKDNKTDDKAEDKEREDSDPVVLYTAKDEEGSNQTQSTSKSKELEEGEEVKL